MLLEFGSVLISKTTVLPPILRLASKAILLRSMGFYVNPLGRLSMNRIASLLISESITTEVVSCFLALITTGF